jgi:hypothetical protein
VAREEAAVVRRVAGFDVLKVLANDRYDGEVRSLLVFGSVEDAELFVAETDGVSLAEGWRAVMVSIEMLLDICDAFGVEHITIPLSVGLDADCIGGRVSAVVDFLREYED